MDDLLILPTNLEAWKKTLKHFGRKESTEKTRLVTQTFQGKLFGVDVAFPYIFYTKNPCELSGISFRLGNLFKWNPSSSTL